MDLLSGRKADEIFQGQVLVYKHIFAYLDSMCLKWCIELGIPDIIHNHGQPIAFHELVSTLQVPPSKISGVQRLMRFMAHNGFFRMVRIHDKQGEKEAYALTVASELLVKRTDYCVSPLIKCAIDPALSVFWDFLNHNPAYMSSFNESMASDSQVVNLALRDHSVVFEGLESIVDVGGGIGTTAKMISETFPKLKCIVFDLPQGVKNLSGSNNLSYVGGDMFNSIPEVDAVLLKWILHDWDDDNCVKILEKCKDAVSSNNKRGKIIIIDIVINEKQDEYEITQIKLKMDISRASVNGKERSEDELKKLFVEAGFQDCQISPLTGMLSLIEVYA